MDLVASGIKFFHVAFPINPSGNEETLPLGRYELDCLGGITIGSARQDLAASCTIIIRGAVCSWFGDLLQRL